jgi:predicted dehydrogenase
MSDLIKRKIGYGIIGCRMGQAHMKGVKSCNDAELKAICDIDGENLMKAAKEFGVTRKDCYTDYKEMLLRDDIDVLVVASPDQVHPKQTIDAFYAGKHVLCEKPMALTFDECKAMIEASEKTGKKLMIGQICRYTPGFIAAKMLIEKGEIGELFFVESEYAHDYSKIPGAGNWRLDPVRLRHPILGGGCHAVDLLRWIAGDPYEVFAYASRKVLKEWPVDDCTIAIMKFPNDVIGKVMTSIGCKRNYTMRSVFYGDKGTIIADNQLPTIKVYKNSLTGKTDVFEGISDHVMGMDYPVEINNHNTAAEIREFTDIILNNKKVVTDGVQGASTVLACLSIVESAQKGEKVHISYSFQE